MKRENQTVDSKQVLGSKFGGYAYSEQMILRFVISKPTQVSKDSSGDRGFNFSLERLQKQRYFWQKKERNTRKLLRTSHLHKYLHISLHVSHLDISTLGSIHFTSADPTSTLCKKGHESRQLETSLSEGGCRIQQSGPENTLSLVKNHCG